MATLNDVALTGVGAHRAAAYTGMQEDYWSEYDQYMDDPSVSAIPSKLARKGSKKLRGRKSVLLARITRPQSAHAAGEGFYAAPPTTTTRINPEITPKKMLAQLGSTLEARADARSGQASWISAVEDDMKGLEEQILQNYIHNIIFGRLNVLGRVKAISGTSITLQPRSNHGDSTSQFWDQGCINGTYGLAVGKSIAFVDSGNGAGGEAFDATDTVVGDPTSTNYATTRRRYITAMDMSDPENIIITVDSSPDTSVDAGDWIIEWGSRKGAMVTDGGETADSIYDLLSMEGVGSAFTRLGIVPAHLGYLKTTYDGLQPNHTSNSAASLSQWTDRFAKLTLRTSIRRCGRAPTKLFPTLAQMDEVEKEYGNMRKFEPVIGRSGADHTTMAILAHGHVLTYHPDWMALPGQMIQTDPSFGEYAENYPLGPAVEGYERRAVDGADMERIVLARRGNIIYSNPMGLGLRSDLVENEYATS